MLDARSIVSSFNLSTSTTLLEFQVDPLTPMAEDPYAKQT